MTAPGDEGGRGGGDDPSPADALGVADTHASSPESIPDSSAAGAVSPGLAGSSSASSAASSSGAGAAIRGVVPGDRLGRYELGDELGAGGMASVFRARDTELRRDVAVKVLFPHLARKPEITRRFQREARAAALLEHANILRVYDVGAGAGQPPYIVMELVRGQSLREVAEAHGPMLSELAASIGALMCDALAVAHAAGVIHRDVKPGNVMLADDGRLLLADFGVARLDDDDSLVTRSGALLGTPSFMAPEQALGNPVDGRSDLYSVGASLYQLVTGGLPFAGPTAKIVADASRGNATPAQRRRPAVGAEMSRLIERLMSPDPERRPASAADAAATLRELAAGGGLGEPAEEMRAFALDRAGWSATHAPTIVERIIERARVQRRRSLPQALSLVDRALALAPEHADALALADELQTSGSRRPLMLGVGVVAVGLAAAGAWMLLHDGSSGGGGGGAVALAGDAGDAGGDGEGDAGGGVDVNAVDAMAVSPGLVDGGTVTDARAAVPASPDAREAMRVRPPIDAGVSVALVAVDAAPAVVMPVDAAAPVIDAAPAPARVTFAFDTWCELVIDDLPRGRADREREVVLGPGRHRASCSQGPGLGAWSETVEVRAGQVRRVEGTLLAPVEVTIDAGDAVRISGQTIRSGDRIVLRPGRYRVEIVVGGRARAPVYVSIPRVARCTLRDRPAVDCYRP